MSLTATERRTFERTGRGGQSLFRRRVRQLRTNQFGMVMIALCFAIVLMAVLAPLIAPFDPLSVEPARRLESPSLSNFFGTDDLGRDVFSRVIFGARVSLRIAVIVVALSVSLGMVVGTIAGYAGGRIDQVAMRVTDIFLAFPPLILAMALSASLGPSVENAAIALGLVWWPGYARLIRGQVLSVKHEPYVEASYAAGASRFRIAARHLLPNSMDPVLVRVTLTGGNAILFSAALSFIGLGAQPPTPEWGLMVSQARRFLAEAWWYSTIVGVVIFLTVLVFTLAADAIQEVVYPD